MGNRLLQPDLPNAPRLRVLAIAVCGLAIGLAGLRASALMSPAPISQSDPNLSALTGIVETVVRPGHVRVSEAHGASGERDFLVVVDAPVAEAGRLRARLTPLITASAALDPNAGDTLQIEVYPFAKGLPGRPSLPALAELGGLLLVSLLAAWILAATGSEPVRRLARPVADNDDGENDAHRRVSATRLSVLPTVEPIHQVAEIAKSDPKRLATTLRDWMAEDQTPS